MPHRVHRGRGGAEEERQAVREALLDSARKLFSSQGFNGVSIRSLAREAGVNSAMIHYYFGDKRGLYREMLSQSAEPVLELLRELNAREPASEDKPLTDFLSAYMRHVATQPWLPALLVRDVLAQDGELRDFFLRDYARPGGGGFLTALVEREIRVGHLRADLDPRLTALSLLSLALFPLIALPISKEVFAMSDSEAYLNELISHTVALFRSGTESRGSNEARAAGKGSKDE